MTKEQIMQHLYDLRVSPVVAAYLDQRIFEGDQGPDDVSAQQIVADCYTAIVDELKDMGITLLDEVEVLSNYQDAHHLITIYSILHEGPALRYLSRITPELKEDIEMLLNDEYTSTDFVEKLLQITSKHSGNDALASALDWVATNVVSCDDTKQYASFYLSLPLTNIPSEDISKVIADYLLEHAQHITNIKATIAHIFKLDPTADVDRDRVAMLVSEYDTDKCDADVVVDYALCDRPDSEIPDYLKEHAVEIMEAHHARAPHHIEYWHAHPGSIITPADVLLVVCHLFDKGSDTAGSLDEKEAWLRSGLLGEYEPLFLKWYQYASGYWS